MRVENLIFKDNLDTFLRADEGYNKIEAKGTVTQGPLTDKDRETLMQDVAADVAEHILGREKELYGSDFQKGSRSRGNDSIDGQLKVTVSSKETTFNIQVGPTSSTPGGPITGYDIEVFKSQS